MRADGRDMVTIPECVLAISDYFENSGFRVEDGNALDDAARELRDLCRERGHSDVGQVEQDDFVSIMERHGL